MVWLAANGPKAISRKPDQERDNRENPGVRYPGFLVLPTFTKPLYRSRTLAATSSSPPSRRSLRSSRKLQYHRPVFLSILFARVVLPEDRLDAKLDVR